MKDKRWIVLSVFIIAILTACIFNFTGIKRNEYLPDESAKQTEQQEKAADLPLRGKIIVVDPGHGLNNISDKERVSPKSDKKKPAYVSGTAGKNQTEEQLNLACGLILKEKLEALGAEVHMTRSGHDAEMSNMGRAEFANNLGADVSVKLHADGSENKELHGISVLVPAEGCLDSGLFESCERLGMCLLDSVVKETAADNRGLSYREDMTGFNWSKVPTALIEMGFMTNPEEDALMETEEYRSKLMDGAVSGLLKYFETR